MENRLQPAARTALAFILFCVAGVCITLSARAQECRSATPQELAAVEKLVHTLQDNVETALVKSGWKVTSENTALPTPQIANHPGPMRPLMVCMRPLDVKFSPDPASAWGRQWQDSVNYYNALGTPDGMKNMFRLVADGDLEIWATENDPYLNTHVSPAARITRLTLPGVPMAFQEVPGGQDGNNGVETQLFFGNWANAKISSGNEAYAVPYPFHHPGSTPFIVNMVLHIHGSPKVCAQVLNGVDWQKLGAALTP
jgi:hypothetical protein